jgi:hypothetical protein
MKETMAAIDDAHEKALPDLMANARKQAQSLATAAQLKLGAFQGVTEGYSYATTYPGPVQPMVTFSAVVRLAGRALLEHEPEEPARRRESHASSEFRDLRRSAPGRDQNAAGLKGWFAG